MVLLIEAVVYPQLSVRTYTATVAKTRLVYDADVVARFAPKIRTTKRKRKKKSVQFSLQFTRAKELTSFSRVEKK